MVVLDVLSAVGSLASIAGEARYHLEKKKGSVVTPPDYSQIPSDYQWNAEAVDQFISSRVGKPIITEEEKKQVYDEFYKCYPEFRFDHDFTDKLIANAINQLEVYLQEKMTPGERVIKSDIDEMKSQLQTLTETVDDIRKEQKINITNNYQNKQIVNNVDIKTPPTVVVVHEPTERVMSNLQLAATGKDANYSNICFSVSSPGENKMHLESIGNDHGLSFVIDYDVSNNKMTLNYHFSGQSAADLFRNTEFVKNAVETGSFAFFHEGKIAIGPIPSALLFEYNDCEIDSARTFARDLLLIESYYDVKFSPEKELDQDDQEWVGILAESIRGRAIPCTWSDASFTGVLHPAIEGMGLGETIAAASGLFRYGYTAAGDLTIGTTHIGEVKVRYELESARINNIEEIQAELDKEPYRESVPVTMKLVPGDNNKGTRKVIFE